MKQKTREIRNQYYQDMSYLRTHNNSKDAKRTKEQKCQSSVANLMNVVKRWIVMTGETTSQDQYIHLMADRCKDRYNQIVKTYGLETVVKCCSDVDFALILDFCLHIDTTIMDGYVD